MRSLPDSEEVQDVIKEAISSLSLEQDRINEFEIDVQGITPIIDKGIQLQVANFQNVSLEDARYLRRLFSNTNPKVIFSWLNN
jgi:hypothetical protein